MKRWLFVDCTETVKGKKPADVYKILADLESWPNWAKSILDTKWIGAPGWKEGNKFGFKAGKGKAGLWMNVTVFKVRENEEIGWGLEIPKLLYVYHNFTFEKDGKDVKVRTTECFDGPLGLPLSLIAGSVLKKGDAEWLRDLAVKAANG